MILTIILVYSLVYSIPVFLFMILFSYLHELGHKKELDKLGITSEIKFHILDNIKKTFKETHPFATINFNEKKFNKLNKTKKTAKIPKRNL